MQQNPANSDPRAIELGQIRAERGEAGVFRHIEANYLRNRDSAFWASRYAMVLQQTDRIAEREQLLTGFVRDYLHDHLVLKQTYGERSEITGWAVEYYSLIVAAANFEAERGNNAEAIRLRQLWVDHGRPGDHENYSFLRDLYKAEKDYKKLVEMTARYIERTTLDYNAKGALFEYIEAIILAGNPDKACSVLSERNGHVTMDFNFFTFAFYRLFEAGYAAHALRVAETGRLRFGGRIWNFLKLSALLKLKHSAAAAEVLKNIDVDCSRLLPSTKYGIGMLLLHNSDLRRNPDITVRQQVRSFLDFVERESLRKYHAHPSAQKSHHHIDVLLYGKRRLDEAERFTREMIGRHGATPGLTGRLVVILNRLKKPAVHTMFQQRRLPNEDWLLFEQARASFNAGDMAAAFLQVERALDKHFSKRGMLLLRAICYDTGKQDIYEARLRKSIPLLSVYDRQSLAWDRQLPEIWDQYDDEPPGHWAQCPISDILEKSPHAHGINTTANHVAPRPQNAR